MSRSTILASFVALAVLLGSVPLLSTAARSGSEDEAEEARARLAAAAARSDLTGENGRPFVLRARIWFWQDASTSAAGTYTLTWASKGEWRDEIVFRDFRQQRGVGADRSWWRRNVAHKPLRIIQLEELLDYPRRLDLADDVKLKAIGQGEGARETVDECFEAKSSRWTRDIFCLHPDDGVLTLGSYPTGHPARLVASRHEYADYRPWNGLLVPYRIRFVEATKPALEIEVAELSALTDPEPGMFAPPDDARSTPWCADPTEPERTAKVRPIYPESARKTRGEGTVTLYAVIGTEGQVLDAAVVRSASPDFDRAALDAVKGWRYRPAMCGDIPVERELSIVVSFGIE